MCADKCPPPGGIVCQQPALEAIVDGVKQNLGVIESRNQLHQVTVVSSTGPGLEYVSLAFSLPHNEDIIGSSSLSISNIEIMAQVGQDFYQTQSSGGVARVFESTVEEALRFIMNGRDVGSRRCGWFEIDLISVDQQHLLHFKGTFDAIVTEDPRVDD